MIRWLVGSSMKLRFLVIILAVILMVAGIYQLGQMPAALYPEIDPPHVEIQTEALGMSAEEVEAFHTVPKKANLYNGVARARPRLVKVSRWSINDLARNTGVVNA